MDQIGLYYTKLPTRMFSIKDKINNTKGTKQMKPKDIVKAMVFTAASGGKVPLAMVGKPNEPRCYLCDNGEPPVAYTNKLNVWFVIKVTLWWILNVFWPHHLKLHGDM